MQFLYVDESGDPGTHQFSSDHFILSGLIVSDNDWKVYLDRLKEFRRYLKNEYGLNQRTEIHSSELIRINKTKEYATIKKRDRINILKEYAIEVPRIFNSSKIINVCIDIQEHKDKDIFDLAWSRLIQRFDTYLKKQAKDFGIIITDDTDSKKLRNLQRKMRVYNPMPSNYSHNTYNATINSIIEDPFSRNSNDSYFIQTVDVISHLLYRKEYPKGSFRKYGLEKYFDSIYPILLKEASKNDELGIVRK